MELFNKEGYTIKEIVLDVDPNVGSSIAQTGNVAKIKGIAAAKVILSPIKKINATGGIGNPILMQFRQDDVTINIGKDGKVVVSDPKIDYKEQLKKNSDLEILDVIKVATAILLERKVKSTIEEASSPIYASAALPFSYSIPTLAEMRDNRAKSSSYPRVGSFGTVDKDYVVKFPSSKEVDDFLQAVKNINAKFPNRFNF